MSQDPDNLAMEKASEAIAPVLRSLGVQPSKSQKHTIASTAVLSWLSNRAWEWSQDRSIAGIGEPDAYTVGFAKAILPKLSDSDLPFEKVLNEWSADEVVRFAALASDLIDDQRATTMETPIDLAM